MDTNWNLLKKKLISEDAFEKYCNCVATTRTQTSLNIEGVALANALQVKIQVYILFKIAQDGFLIDEYGSMYKHVVKIAFINGSQEFLPIGSVTNQVNFPLI